MHEYEEVSLRDDVYLEAGSPLAEIALRLAERHPGVIGSLAYGSCLRSGDLFDGLVDFYLITEEYLQTHRALVPAFFNWLVPPNVYYAQFNLSGGIVRVKYSLLSIRSFQRGCEHRFESYFWARFAQPVGIYGFDDPSVKQKIEAALCAAAQRLIRESLRTMPESFSWQDIWAFGLRASYASELRAEKTGRVDGILAHNATHYERLAGHFLGSNPDLERLGDGPWRHYPASYLSDFSRCKWFLRKIFGKVLSVVRLVKAYFTFRHGIDYLAWKLARHSGVTIEVPTKVRRYPLIFGWAFFLRLYRRGVFK